MATAGITRTHDSGRACQRTWRAALVRMRVLGVLCVLAMVGAQAWWCPGCLPGQLAESEDCSETEESRPEASHERHTARDLIRVAHHQEDPRDSARPIAGTVALDRLTGPVAAPAACPLFMRHCRLLM